jgi:pimeloyl-ACP methyl ester carboxylesterase
MSNVVVLIHGSANGSHSWGRVRRELASEGARGVAPDRLGYGGAPPPTTVVIGEARGSRRGPSRGSLPERSARRPTSSTALATWSRSRTHGPSPKRFEMPSALLKR